MTLPNNWDEAINNPIAIPKNRQQKLDEALAEIERLKDVGGLAAAVKTAEDAKDAAEGEVTALKTFITDVLGYHDAGDAATALGGKTMKERLAELKDQQDEVVRLVNEGNINTANYKTSLKAKDDNDAKVVQAKDEEIVELKKDAKAYEDARDELADAIDGICKKYGRTDLTDLQEGIEATIKARNTADAQADKVRQEKEDLQDEIDEYVAKQNYGKPYFEAIVKRINKKGTLIVGGKKAIREDLKKLEGYFGGSGVDIDTDEDDASVIVTPTTPITPKPKPTKPIHKPPFLGGTLSDNEDEAASTTPTTSKAGSGRQKQHRYHKLVERLTDDYSITGFMNSWNFEEGLNEYGTGAEGQKLEHGRGSPTGADYLNTATKDGNSNDGEIDFIGANIVYPLTEAAIDRLTKTGLVKDKKRLTKFLAENVCKHPSARAIIDQDPGKTKIATYLA